MFRIILCPMVAITVSACALAQPTAAGSRAEWPAARHDHRLTARQPVAGALAAAPTVLTRTPIAPGWAHLRPFAAAPDGEPDRALAMIDGGLRCFSLAGELLWQSHPPGLNFHSLSAIEDLDGDGRVEIAVMAGRPGWPLGAALLLDAATGDVRWRYDVEPISYAWYLHIGHYLPGGANAVGKQLIVLEHGYPPDKLNGYIALFEFPAPGAAPAQRWRYDFHQYTAFPTLLTSDVDGDGAAELCVQTHSRMWVLDALTGAVKQFAQWDVSPANIRSYGLVKFQDLDGDGREDFLCIATFAQHHEVLLNRGGRLEPAWAHGWDTSVTTSKIATTWAEPPVADVDGDGRLEIILSMFNAEGEPRWMTRVYDAVTGEVKARILDHIAVSVADADGDGRPEILTNLSRDPTRTVVEGAALIALESGVAREVWRDPAARARPGARSGELLVERDGATFELKQAAGAFALAPWAKPPKPGPDLSAVAAPAGQLVPPPLVADLDGDARPEIIHAWQGKVTVYRWDRATGLSAIRDYPASGDPVIADLDGDGRPELIVGEAGADREPAARALRADGSVLWESRLPPSDRRGLPHGRAVYLQAGRFTGRPAPDVYALFGTPIVRSVVLDGASGRPVWEKSEFPTIERYWGPTVNLAAVYDVDGDGAEDLVFTNPDYYCAASGRSGDMLAGPAIPQKIFNQPSQGLYTLPAILEGGREPLVVLCDGHYFLGAIGLRAEPRWYRLPELGEARTGAEGFARLSDRGWLIGFGRQDGDFACLEAATGEQRWRLPIAASAHDAVACDIDGDGADEFVFGDSHGRLWAVADRDGEPAVKWRLDLGAAVGAPVIADLDGDGALEIVVPTADGCLTVVGAEKTGATKPGAK